MPLRNSLLLLFPIELFAALLVYIIPLKKRKHFKFKLMLSFAIGLISINLIPYLISNFSYEPYIMYGGLCFTIFIIMIFIAFATCKITFKEAVFAATCSYLTEHFVYATRILLSSLFYKGLYDSLTIPYFIFHFVIYTFSYFKFSKKMINKGHYRTTAYRSIGFSLSTLFLVLFMSLIASKEDFLVYHSIYAIFSCFFVLYSQVYQINQLNLQKDLNINQQIWYKYKEQYSMSKENIDIINRKSHDLKHQLTALKNIKDSNERYIAISELEKDIYIYNSFIKTGNEILDTILTEKSLIANEKKINLNCIINGNLLTFIDTIDLYTLFGNIIDNAIEGVATLNPNEHKNIGLYVTEKANLIIIQIENKYTDNLTFKDNLPYNKSKDKNYHGFGLKSIIYISEKYNGVVDIQTQNNIFLLRITFQKDNII